MSTGLPDTNCQIFAARIPESLRQSIEKFPLFGVPLWNRENIFGEVHTFGDLTGLF